MNFMSIISTLVTIAFLGFLYWRMVKRELPQPVGAMQALLPIALGLLSHPLTLPFSMASIKSQAASGTALKLSELSFAQSLERSFIVAGGLEEIAKLVLIIVVLLVFRGKVKNVYEYVLIGACVGFGFSIIEEFSYGADDASVFSTVMRMISVPAHMTFSMIMAEFLGRAKYSKLTGKGSAALSYVLAAVVPVAVHTLYDARTAFNPDLVKGEMAGIAKALIGYVGLMAYEIVVLIRFKKKTRQLCEMSLLRGDTSVESAQSGEDVK